MSLEKLDFRPELLLQRLPRLDRSANSICTIARWLSFYAQSEAIAVADGWVIAGNHDSGDPERLLCLLYVAHELLLITADSPHRQSIVDAFGRLECIPSALSAWIAGLGPSGDELRREAGRLALIWKQRQLLPQSIVSAVEGVAGPTAASALLTCPSSYPELVAVSKRMAVAVEAHAAADSAVKRRRHNQQDGLPCRPADLRAEMQLLRQADTAQRELGDAAGLVTSRLQAESERITQRQAELQRILGVLGPLERKWQARRAAAGAAAVGSRRSAKRKQDREAGDRLPTDGPLFAKGDRVWYLRDKCEVEVLHVEHQLQPVSYTVLLPSGGERSIEEIHLESLEHDNSDGRRGRRVVDQMESLMLSAFNSAPKPKPEADIATTGKPKGGPVGAGAEEWAEQLFALFSHGLAAPDAEYSAAGD
eukprot:TRINITY_DN60140_c0_g1_i1.p1 TRINITY_DN60140_c0_g1~~TRINITY_DN60140_c0_g1_i1.p1  ORF type:complete len:445 (+),score=152.50 TRINITY_DN60140_c0_g1_i1:72-1337(+)